MLYRMAGILIASFALAGTADAQVCAVPQHQAAVVQKVVQQQAQTVYGVQAAQVVEQVVPYEDDFYAQLLQLAQDRQAFDLQLRQEQKKQEYFLQALAAINGPAYVDERAAQKTAPAPVPYAKQGATVYGYQKAVQSQSTPDVELRVLYQQAARLTENAQAAAHAANQEFLQLAEQQAAQVAQGRAAKLELLSRMVQLLEEDGAARPEQDAPASPAPTDWAPPPPPNPEIGASLDAQLRYNALTGVVQAKCVGCHNPEKPARLNLQNFADLTQEQRQHAHELVATTDETMRMPKGKPALSAEEIALFQYFAENEVTFSAAN